MIEYRLIAQKPDGVEHLVITDTKTRAIQVWLAFRAAGGYAQVWLEVGGRRFEAQEMEELP